MELTPRRKGRLAAAGSLVALSFMVYMLSGSGPIGPPYRDESLTAGMEPLRLVDQASIRAELNLSDAQAETIRETVEKQSPRRRMTKDKDADPTERQARMGRKHQEAFLAQVLDAQQLNRLHQIILQRLGGLALNNKQTADALALTKTQREKVDAILANLSSKLSSSAGNWTPEARKQNEAARTGAGESMLAVLTPEQQGRWKELLGEPFTGEINLGPRGFGPQGGRPGKGATQQPPGK
jgi:hypothetical protein